MPKWCGSLSPWEWGSGSRAARSWGDGFGLGSVPTGFGAGMGRSLCLTKSDGELRITQLLRARGDSFLTFDGRLTFDG